MPELFPRDAYPNGPYHEQWQVPASELPGLSHTRQVLRHGTYPVLRPTDLTYTERNPSNLVTALRFWVARGGTVESFWFWTFNLYLPHKVYVGLGDGSTRTFVVPLQNLQTALLTPVAYLDGVAQSASDWSWTTDEATSPYRKTMLWAVGKAPATGKVIEVEACGRRLITAAFVNKVIDPTLTEGDLVSVTLGIREVA